MTNCIATIEGCDLCEEHNARRDPDHECAAMCELLQSMMDGEEGHRVWHEPLRHGCGFILDDKRGNKFHGEPRRCPFDNCVQFFCPGCRRYDMGWGPIACPCETGRNGHGTYDEHRKPHPPVKIAQRKPEPAQRRYSRHEPKKFRNHNRGRA